METVFLISGASRGLGAAITAACLQQGGKVAAFSRGRSPFVEQHVANDPDESRYLWRHVDGTSQEQVRAFVAQVLEKFGRVDCLVNNAAHGLEGLLTFARADEVDKTISLNLTSTITLTQACAKAMLRQGSGCIINISSLNAIRGHSGLSVYSATKAALDGLTRSLARELGPRNIRVNSVAPGYFDSDMVKNLTTAQKETIQRRTPLGRLGSAEDIAAGVLFLSSDAASFITGHTLVVDGGITC